MMMNFGPKDGSTSAASLATQGVYQQHARPAWAPSALFFSAVWFVLYVLIQVVWVRVYNRSSTTDAMRGLLITNGVLNLLFMPVFQHIQGFFGAMLSFIIALAVFATALFINIRLFVTDGQAARDIPSACCWLPYLCWLAYACILTGQVFDKESKDAGLS